MADSKTDDKVLEDNKVEEVDYEPHNHSDLPFPHQNSPLEASGVLEGAPEKPEPPFEFKDGVLPQNVEFGLEGPDLTNPETFTVPTTPLGVAAWMYAGDDEDILQGAENVKSQINSGALGRSDADTTPVKNFPVAGDPYNDNTDVGTQSDPDDEGDKIATAELNDEAKTEQPPKRGRRTREQIAADKAEEATKAEAAANAADTEKDAIAKKEAEDKAEADAKAKAEADSK